ncbi:MAG: hypothetical protein JWM16_1668 [Verrucomicrobiales bacterium]|nr:hypothetical protein [Verrucomicrobiales bacterium]
MDVFGFSCNQQISEAWDGLLPKGHLTVIGS